jgi:pyrimidine deaminase RibD-like protein
MGNGQAELSRILSRYRAGRYEAGYAAQLLGGVICKLDPQGKIRILEALWSELSADFQRAVKGEAVASWIFPVAIPCWVRFGDTAVMTKRLIGMLVPDEACVTNAWTTHLSPLLCDALQRHYESFAQAALAVIEAWVGELRFAINAEVDAYHFGPELVRVINRIDDIIQDKRSEPLDQALLAASNAAQSVTDRKGHSALGSAASVRPARHYNDPIPASLAEIDTDIDYWMGRLGEGEPGSNHEYWVSSRLSKLRHARTRLVENQRAGQSEDRGFCQLAIEEARKSVPEDDRRDHPNVGAVIVRDGRVLAVAHRGEFAGCHAEYVALERKLADVSVSGATVYTTLEPCRTRTHPKVPCADRLVERRVERVVIGMLDPDPRISGRGQRTLRRGRIATDLFPTDLMDQVEELNRDFIRTHEREAGGSGSRTGVAQDPHRGLVSSRGAQIAPQFSVRCCRGFGDEARQLLHGLAVNPKGDVIIVGDFWGSMDFGGSRLTSAGDRDIFVAKFDHNGNHIWSNRYGDASEQVGVGVCTDAAGAVYVLAAFAGTLQFGGAALTSRGRYNVALAKLDEAGHPIWSRCFGDENYHVPECMALAPSGQILIAGRFQGSVDFGSGSMQSRSKQTDIFLAAFSADGECLWAKGLAGPYEQQTRSIAVDGDGNIALTGVFKGAFCVDGLTLAERSPSDYRGFLAKLDSRGNALWCKRFGDPFAQQGGAVAFDRCNGDILAAGFIVGAPTLAPRASPTLGLLVRYDPTGVLRWSRTFGPHAWPASLAVAPDGRILLTGHFEGAVDFGVGVLTSAGGNDIFAALLAPGGGTQWARRFGDARQQFLVNGEFGRDGSLVLAGSFHGTIDFGTGPLTASGYDGRSEGNEDVFLAILDESPPF